MLNLALSRESYYHLQKNINESSLCLSALMAPLLLLKVCVTANKRTLRAAMLRLLTQFTSKELLLSVATVKRGQKKKKTLAHTHLKRPTASFSRRHVVQF